MSAQPRGTPSTCPENARLNSHPRRSTTTSFKEDGSRRGGRRALFERHVCFRFRACPRHALCLRPRPYLCVRDTACDPARTSVSEKRALPVPLPPPLSEIRALPATPPAPPCPRYTLCLRPRPHLRVRDTRFAYSARTSVSHDGVAGKFLETQTATQQVSFLDRKRHGRECHYAQIKCSVIYD